MGADRLNSDVDLDFTHVRGSFALSRQLTEHVGAVFSDIVPYSGDVLALSEQIGFSGRLFGLAYPAGEIADDKGWGLSLEFNRAFAYNGAYLQQIQLYVRADVARVYVNNHTLSHDEIASIGFGVRFTDQEHYSLDLSIAQLVGEIPVNASRRSPRLNLSYAYQFE